jgi:hypothetical protein
VEDPSSGSELSGSRSYQAKARAFGRARTSSTIWLEPLGDLVDVVRHRRQRRFDDETGSVGQHL